MTSKLDYLKKYLSAPGTGGDVAKPATSIKEKKKRRKGSQENTDFQIRDLSEVLPIARGEQDSTTCRGRKSTASLLKTKGGEAMRDELVFVDEKEIEEAEKSRIAAEGLETSGVAWKISLKPKGSRRQQTAVKQEVKEEVKEEEGSDISPPREAARRGPPAAQRRAAGSDSDDLSPPRAGTHGSKAPLEPTVKQEADSDGDTRPVTAKVQRKRHDSDDDLSPPRAAPANASSSQRKRHDSDDDLSPPRAAPAKASASQRQRHDSDDDLSPPRAAPTKASASQRKRHNSDDDLSPPRSKLAEQKRQKLSPNSDISPPRDAPKAKKEKKGSDNDVSPPRAAPKAAAGRRRHDSDSDLSPPRKEAEEEPEKMSSGLRAGLVRGSDLKEEAAQVRKERREAVEAAPDSQTGRGATTVYRNREGRQVSREEWVDQQQKKRKKRLADYPEQELEWGGGLKQQSNREEELAEVERIAAQPFARYEPDEKYMEELKEKQNWNDPMRKRSDDDKPVADSRTDDQKVQKPKCPHAPWPNRFNILPGYRWDGKIRGNGYEKRWMETKNQREWYNAQKFMYEQVADDN